MNVSLNHQLLHLTGLLQLEHRARQTTGRELDFLIVNETMDIVPYQQAALWRIDGPVVLSGVADPDPLAPYRAWIGDLFAAITKQNDVSSLHVIDLHTLPSKIADAWSDWLPRHALWCPLKHPRGHLLGGLLLARADHWGGADMQMLEFLTGQYGQCLALAGQTSRRWLRLPRRPRRVAIAFLLGLLIIGGLLTPIRRSVVAPAEVISIAPAPIRAPFEGVVGSIHVVPNAMVHAGDRLVSLDRTQLETQRDVAAKALEMARAEYGVSSQQALNDPQAKARLSLLAGKVEQRASELAYARGLLDRSELVAPIDGVAVFSSAAEWTGKPVALGERIMQIASPLLTALEVDVPAADAITFEPGSEVLFFSNVSPDTPVRATLEYGSDASAPTPDGVMAYTFRCRFDTGAGQRLGTTGSAKIYGARQALGLWTFRRPIAMMRQWLAL